MRVSDALLLGDCEKADKETLLAAILECDRAYLLAHPEKSLTEKQGAAYAAFMTRRTKGEPVAYILGTKEFFGRSFIVSPVTLIPRPATELLVECALKTLRGETIERTVEIDREIVAWTEVNGKIDDVATIVDIGTGSGCIAITLALALPNMRIIATDVSSEALKVAEANAQRHGVSDCIDFLIGSAAEPLNDVAEPFFIVSNPPYIPDGTTLENDVATFEPHAALFAGKDGTDVIEAIVESARKKDFCRGFCIECGVEQAK